MIEQLVRNSIILGEGGVEVDKEFHLQVVDQAMNSEMKTLYRHSML
jgi:hypothetical protein